MVGGGDSSFTESLYLAHLCKSVKILVRKEKARAEEIWVKKVSEEPNMEVIYNTEVAEINGQFSIEFAQQGATTLGIEVREANVKKAIFCKEILNLNKLEFQQEDARNISKETKE